MPADGDPDAPTPAEPASAAPRPSPRDRLDALVAWGRAVRAELERLPDTLRTAREGAANFQLVSQRLMVATESLEDVAAMYEATIADAARRSTAAADRLRAQVESLAAAASPERLPSVVDEIQRNIDALARSNPLWPRPREPRDPGA